MPDAGHSILIVEDEALVRFDLVEFFENAGWRVFEARSADEAIGLLERHGAVHAVVTDVEMPGSMDGIRLAHAVQRRFPPAALFVVSGDVPVTADALPAGSTFLSKPFDHHRLLARIESALG